MITMSVSYVEAEEYDAQGNDINQLWMAHKNFGIIDGLEVTPTSPASMDVIIGTGTAQLGEVEVVKSTTTQLTLTADANNPRKIPSSERGRKTYKPKPPPIPNDKVVLAEIYIDANDTEIESSDIKDRRVFIVKSGGLEGDIITRDVIRTHNSIDKQTIEAGDPTIETQWDNTTGEKVIKVISSGSSDIVHFDFIYYLPLNFAGWRTNNCIAVKVRIPLSSAKAIITVYDTNGNAEAVTKTKTTTGVEDLSFDANELTGTYTAGERIKIRLTAKDFNIGNRYVLFGYIRLHMKINTES